MKSTEKKSFILQYEKTSQKNEFLYELLLYVLKQEGYVYYSAFRYDSTNATYFLYQDLKDPLKEKIIAVLNQIENIKPLFDLKDPQNIFLNKEPELIQKTFYYNPYRTTLKYLELKNNKEEIIEKIKTANITKKSSYLKIDFYNLKQKNTKR